MGLLYFFSESSMIQQQLTTFFTWILNHACFFSRFSESSKVFSGSYDPGLDGIPAGIHGVGAIAVALAPHLGDGGFLSHGDIPKSSKVDSGRSNDTTLKYENPW